MKKVTGNLLDLAEEGKFNIIVHGCNCFCVMGGGIAREIADRYPSAWSADRAFSYPADYNKLGNYSWTQRNGFLVINAYTQYDMSRGTDVFEYAAFELILKKLAFTHPSGKFGFPRIGMGLAGGDEDTIMMLLEEFADTIRKTGGEVTLVEFGG